MHSFLTVIVTFLVLISTAAAAAIPRSPATGLPVSHKTSQPNDPAPIPVDILDLADYATMTPASTTFTYKDILETVKWGTALQLAGVYRGKKSGQYPNGRFPHFYDDQKFTFNDRCPADKNRLEYPIMLDDIYNGGISTNYKYGDHRVVFYIKQGGEPTTGGNPIVYFRGGLTHEGMPKGQFQQCLCTRSAPCGSDVQSIVSCDECAPKSWGEIPHS